MRVISKNFFNSCRKNDVKKLSNFYKFFNKSTNRVRKMLNFNFVDENGNYAQHFAVMNDNL